MNTCLSYAGEHWVNEGENPPTGFIVSDPAAAQVTVPDVASALMAGKRIMILSKGA